MQATPAPTFRRTAGLPAGVYDEVLSALRPDQGDVRALRDDAAIDELLVRREKGDGLGEPLRYEDFPVNQERFHWQSQAGTRQDDRLGRRHVRPHEENVTPLLFVRERKKDARGVTCAFRFLGAVTPARVQGERPISIEWRLEAPLRAEWVRRWGNVA